MRLPCIILLMFVAVTAVDRSNFKSCDQSGFCKRHRATAEGLNRYQALLETVTIEPTNVQLQVMNVRSKVKLNLQVSALEGNMARLRITEHEGIKDRYEPPIGDVLVGEPKQDGIKVEKSSDRIGLLFGHCKLVINSEPFRIDVFNNGELVTIINSRGLLKYEHYRQKPGMFGRLVSYLSQPFRQPPPEKAEGEEAVDKEGEPAKEEQHANVEEGDELWEETFKSHTDTKPFGPSSVGLDVSFPGFEFVYGIPEHADSLALKSTKNTDPYRLYNLDVFEYELNNPMALYGSVPLMIAHNEKRTLGLFWLNAAETWIDISSNTADKNFMSKMMEFVAGGDDGEIPQVDTHWFSESGIIDVFLLLGPTPAAVFKQYAVLTGTTPLPPLFGISYHQSRWNYNDQQDVANVNNGFDEHNIPMDVIWLDIEHTDGKRYFTWDSNKFPNSVKMLNDVSAFGRKMVTIVDPHIKRDDGFGVHQQMKSNDFYIKNKDSGEYDGWCWPGSSSWPDFTCPAVRDFWASKFSLSEYAGSTNDLFIWNDMNEPSVFNGPEITMHKDAKHCDGWEHRDVHNIYGLYVHRATTEGLEKRSGMQERPFVLSRAFFAGSQRYGAVWTGDNTGEWGHLRMSIPMVLSLNLVGITLSGADVGGFFKNCEPELLTRWYQAAAYQPFFRAHAHLDTRRREPWLLPENHMLAIRAAIRERYALLPYWYTLFYLGEKTGSPVMRPLWVEFPADKNTFAVDSEHLVGNALLVHPVTDQGAAGVNIYLPGKDTIWYDTRTFGSHAGGANIYYSTPLEMIPVLQRGGTIVPRKERMRRSSSLTYHDPYTLTIALDKEGQAEGSLYIDDYHSFDYKQGKYSLRTFLYADGQLSNQNADTSGSFTTQAWLERVTVVGVKTAPRAVTIVSYTLGKQSLDFSYTESSQVLLIRKPGVIITEDFTIRVDF